MQKKCSEKGRNWGDFHPQHPFGAALLPFRAHLSCRRHKMVSHFTQVDQRKQYLQLCCVLGQNFLAFLYALIARIAQNNLFLTMRQGLGRRDIVDVGCGADDGVRQAIHAYADGGAGRLKWIGSNTVHLQQVAKVQDPLLVRNTAPGQRQLGKFTNRIAVTQRFFHRRIRQVEPLPHEVDAQHHFQRIRPATLARLRVVRLNQFREHLRGNSTLHLSEKPFAAGHFTLASKLDIGKTQLAYRNFLDRLSLNNLYSDRFDRLDQSIPGCRSEFEVVGCLSMTRSILG